MYSSCFIALGLVAGIILNAVEARGRRPAVPWTDSIVVSSALLLVWLLAATIFEWLYKPAQQGRKVAYLTVASFLFLGRRDGHAPRRRLATRPRPRIAVKIQEFKSSGVQKFDRRHFFGPNVRL